MTAHQTLYSPHRYVCSVCGRQHGADETEYTCLSCGPSGILEPVPVKPASSWETIFSSDPGMWRYAGLLALPSDAPRPPLPVGGTPLVHAERLAHQLGMDELYIKNDALNPTGSLKDRASAAVLARAASIGVERVAVASTGNAGSSLAGLAASMGIPAVIFVPASAPRAKLVQALTYGAQVFAVQGSYDDAFDLCMKASEAFGWYNRNTVYEQFENPASMLQKSIAFDAG